MIYSQFVSEVNLRKGMSRPIIVLPEVGHGTGWLVANNTLYYRLNTPGLVVLAVNLAKPREEVSRIAIEGVRESDLYNWGETVQLVGDSSDPRAIWAIYAGKQNYLMALQLDASLNAMQKPIETTLPVAHLRQLFLISDVIYGVSDLHVSYIFSLKRNVGRQLTAQYAPLLPLDVKNCDNLRIVSKNVLTSLTYSAKHSSLLAWKCRRLEMYKVALHMESNAQLC